MRLTLSLLVAARCLSPISATNLLSSAPARSSVSRTSGSRRSDLRFPLCALDSEPSHGGWHRAFHDGAGSPQAATQLRARAQLGPCSWLRPFPLSPEGCSAFPNVTHANLLSRMWAEGTWPLTLPVAPLRFPEQHRGHREEPELFPPATHQRGWLSKLEAPSSDRSLLLHSAPKLGMQLSGCHWYLRFAASAQLPTCVHARLSRARPNPRQLLPRFGL